MDAVLETLRELVPEVLEAMFFAEAVVVDREYGWQSPDQLWSRIELISPVGCTMWIAANTELVGDWLELIAAAKPETVPMVQLLGELANTVAGKLEIELAAGNEPTKVGLPNGGKGRLSDAPAFEQALVFEIGTAELAVGLEAA